METIIKHGHEKILRLFYNDKSARIHLRDIARKAKLNENSTSRFLSQLEAGRVLRAEKDANLKKYRLARNDKVHSIMSFFDIAGLNSLPNIRKNAILYFLNFLKEKPVICVLFGSTAKNTYKESSDIDLLLITNAKISTKEAEGYADAQTSIKISPIQITYGEFKEELKLKHDKVVQSAVYSGYPITNHIEYYRMIYNEGI